MRQLTRSHVMAEAINSNATIKDDPKRIEFELDDLAIFVKRVVSESLNLGGELVGVERRFLLELECLLGEVILDCNGEECRSQLDFHAINRHRTSIDLILGEPRDNAPKSRELLVTMRAGEAAPTVKLLREDWRIGYEDGSGMDTITTNEKTIMRGGDSFGNHFGFYEPADLVLAAAAPTMRDALIAIDERLRSASAEHVSASDAYDSFYQDIIADALAAASKAPAVHSADDAPHE